MIEIGVFIPIGSRGWFMSTTSPETYPTFDLNKTIVQRAEHWGMDFALSMVKLRGFDGPSEYWVHNLEPFTMMAGIAACTKKIQLYSSIALLTIPPAVAARMVATIDSIAPGRFGVNIVTGWQPKEYQQMGLWPGEEHFARRYDYAAEYVTVMKDLWETGVSDFKGEYFQMDDCKLSPRPSAMPTIVAAAASDRGMQFVAEHCDVNFLMPGGQTNEPEKAGMHVPRLMAQGAKTGRDIGAYVPITIIADRTDEMAFAKWEHYKEGTDMEALAWQYGQSSQDKQAVGKDSTANQLVIAKEMALPNAGAKLIGSYETVAKGLDVIAETPGLRGIMLIFDDFIVGMEQFGEHIQPLMKSRAALAEKAAAA